MSLSVLTDEQRIGWAREQQTTYQPNEQVNAGIARVSMGLLVGASGSGKSFLIDRVIEVDPRFSGLGSITTRNQRSTEPDNYRFISIKEFVEKIDSEELVQYEVHPEIDAIYGSDLESYATDLVVGPILPRSVDVFQKANFKHSSTIGIVAPGEQWRERLGERREDPNSNYGGRLREALNSTTWLQRRYMDIPILVNETGQGETTAQRIIELTTEGILREDIIRHMGTVGTMVEMQRVAEQELEKVEE